MTTPIISVFRDGNTALITGGASGIGLALAKRCHNAGMRVAIVDNNSENLELAKRSIGERTSIFPMDVGSLADWESVKRTISADFGRIDLLALNAGTGLRGTWTDASYFQKIMQTNFFGVTNGISTFLPDIRFSATTSNPSTIIITGSKQGITNPPGNPAYNASKAAVKSLAEGLSWELRANDAISVHLLVPGWTYTGLSGAKPGSVDGKPSGAWSSEQVVAFLEAKMEKREFYIICPDNDVTQEMDKRRMLWAAGDVVYERQPLSRWREDTKDEAAEGIEGLKL